MNVTFSRTFPATHCKKGQPTYFVEGILTQLGIDYKTGNYYKWLIENNPKISDVFLMHFFDSLQRDIFPKSHTIRNHKRPLKVGDFINPTCWAGKPYNKTVEGFWKIKFAPYMEVKKMFDTTISIKDKHIFIDETTYCGKAYFEILEEISANDGLLIEDFTEWFNKQFSGKIICWNENLKY